MRYAAYVRVSREEQVLGYSLEAQERLVRDWLGQQRGDLSGELAAVYRDEGHSARTDDRPCPGRIIPSVTLHGDMMVSPATAGSNRGASRPIRGENRPVHPPVA